MAWALELVQHRKFEIVRMSFMLAGHTKFSVDQLFSQISQTFNRSDVFTTKELAGVAEAYATVLVDNGDIVTEWRPVLDKYTKMPGKRSLHDFVFAKNPTTGDAMVQVRDLCYDGPLQQSTIKVASGHQASDLAIPMSSSSYRARGLIKEISSSKMAHLKQMYNNFIAPDRHLDILPPRDP